MKKIISALLLVALFTVIIAPAALAAGSAEISVSSATVAPGEEVTLTVAIANNPGFGSGKFIVNYDASVLTLTAITVGELLPEATSLVNLKQNLINTMNAKNVTANGVLFTATFTVADTAADGDYNVSVTVSNLNSADKGNASVATTVTAGTVTVATPHVCSGTLVEAKDATCTENGNIAYYVCECGKLYSDKACTKEITAADTVVKATGHDWEAATCTEPKTCKKCDATEGNANGHAWEWVTDKEATCGADGEKHEECKNCDAKQSEGTKIDATGKHTWEWVTDKEATTTEEGEKHEECKDCGTKRNEGTKIPVIDDVPEMGDNTTIYVIFALIALVSLAGVYYTTKKFNK